MAGCVRGGWRVWGWRVVWAGGRVVFGGLPCLFRCAALVGLLAGSFVMRLLAVLLCVCCDCFGVVLCCCWRAVGGAVGCVVAAVAAAGWMRSSCWLRRCWLLAGGGVGGWFCRYVPVPFVPGTCFLGALAFSLGSWFPGAFRSRAGWSVASGHCGRALPLALLPSVGWPVSGALGGGGAGSLCVLLDSDGKRPSWWWPQGVRPVHRDHTRSGGGRGRMVTSVHRKRLSRLELVFVRFRCITTAARPLLAVM